MFYGWLGPLLRSSFGYIYIYIFDFVYNVEFVQHYIYYINATKEALENTNLLQE